MEALRRDEPSVICGLSLPDRNHPGRVRLAPWAQSVAEKLHAQFAGDLELTVGFLGYPEATLRAVRDPRDGLGVADPTQLSNHVFTEDGRRQMMVAWLRFLDVFTKIEKTWYIAERQVILQWSETRPLGHRRQDDIALHMNATARWPCNRRFPKLGWRVACSVSAQATQ